MDDQEILQAFKEAAADDLRFYSNLGKPERERWVVSELLRQLSIPFAESELLSPEQQSKVDVLFRSANFQVKEIVDPGIQRGRVAKEAFNGLKEAKTLEEIRLPSIVVWDATTPALAVYWMAFCVLPRWDTGESASLHERRSKVHTRFKR